MIVGTDKGFEECPGPACGLPQKEYLVTRQPRAAAGQRPAYPPADCRRGGPQQDDGKCGEQCSRHDNRGADRCGDRDYGRDPHAPKGRVESRPTAACQRLIGFSFGLTRRTPFEKPAMSEQQPAQRAQDCIEARTGLVRKARQHEQHLTEVAARCPHCGNEMLQQQHLGRLPQQVQKGRDDGRNDQNAEDGQGPEPASIQCHPSEQQQRCQCCRDKTAPEIVENFPP